MESLSGFTSKPVAATGSGFPHLQNWDYHEETRYALGLTGIITVKNSLTKVYGGSNKRHSTCFAGVLSESNEEIETKWLGQMFSNVKCSHVRHRYPPCIFVLIVGLHMLSSCLVVCLPHQI